MARKGEICQKALDELQKELVDGRGDLKKVTYWDQKPYLDGPQKEGKWQFLSPLYLGFVLGGQARVIIEDDWRGEGGVEVEDEGITSLSFETGNLISQASSCHTLSLHLKLTITP